MKIKTTNLHAGLLAIALALLTAGSLAAQEAPKTCPEDGTWGDCLAERLNELATLKDVIQQTQDKAQDESNEKTDGVLRNALIGAATGSEVNVEDFLSSLLATLDIDGLESTDSGFKFKKNFQVSGGTLAVDLVADKGELFPELKMKLEGAEQTDLIETLNGELEDFDDLSLNLTYSIDKDGKGKRTWWGRRYRDPKGAKTGNGAVATTLFQQIATHDTQLQLAFDAFKAAIQEHVAPLPDGLNTLVKDTPPAASNAMKAKITELVAAEKVGSKAFEKDLTDDQYFAFGKLVANQPQFVLKFGRSERDELVGRNSWTASVKYEVGHANVNGLRDECPELEPYNADAVDTRLEAMPAKTLAEVDKRADAILKAKADRVECYKGFLRKKEGALKKNWRVALNGSYSWVDDYDYASPDGAVTLMLKESETWDASLSAGRTLRFLEDPDDPNKKIELTRFDLEATYENATGDTQKQARFVSTATFTQKINAGFSLAAGVVYANRPEFRGDVDEEFSARAGLKVSLQPKKDE